jgi:SAM-dependent methyltransferase
MIGGIEQLGSGGTEGNRVVEQVEVSAADIARIAGVRPSAVSNWRRRHDDFPKPVGGTDKSPRFDLVAVQAWLRSQGRAAEVPESERLWRVFDSARGTMPIADALGAAGLLLFYLRRNPTAGIPRTAAGMHRLLDDAERDLTVGSHTMVPGLIGKRIPFKLGARETTMLSAVAKAATGRGPADVFDYLCERAFEGGSRTGLATTPPELAELMLDLAGGTAKRLLDPACGSGTVLLAAAQRGYARVEGQEQDASLAMVSALRLAFAGAGAFDVYIGDSLRHDAYQLPSADAVICNPPFADRNWGLDELADDPRWVYGVPPRPESELAWLQHALAHVVPGGPVVMLMPPAAASRPSGRRLRARLLQDGALRAVISLPPKLAAHYALALQIWVLIHPEQDRAHSHVLFVDASGFSARTTREMEAAPSWHEVRHVVTKAWAAFNANPGQVSTASDAAVAVPVIDLLNKDVDLTPGRHVRPPREIPVSRAKLATQHDHLANTLAELCRLLPQPPKPGIRGDRPIRDVSLDELAQRGAIYIRRAAPRASEASESGPRTEGRILLAQDIARAVPPSGTGEIIIDEVRNPVIREGDILVPAIGRRLTARVAEGSDVGAYLSPTVFLIRPDAETIDPWFLAGFLSSSSGGRQSARMASTLGENIHFEPRRARVPLLPIDTQRAYGETFRRLWDFARTLRAAHDEGIDFVRNMIDATASSMAKVSGREPQPGLEFPSRQPAFSAPVNGNLLDPLGLP